SRNRAGRESPKAERAREERKRYQPKIAAKMAAHFCFPDSLRRRSNHSRRHPFAQRICSAAIQTPRQRKSIVTLRADSLRLKSIEGLAALDALPKRSDWWCCLAARTSKPFAARQFCQAG